LIALLLAGGLPLVVSAQDYDDDSGVDERDDDSGIDERDDDSGIDEGDDDRDYDGTRDPNAGGGRGGVNGSNDGDRFVTTRDYSESDPTPPERPGVVDRDGVEVAEDAGVGSELAYASQTVLELGGTFSFFNHSETTQFTLSPFLGYFIIDGLQLSLLGQFTINHISANDDDPLSESRTDFIITLIAEPSYHLSITNEVYVFLGLGLGASFSKDQSADFVFRPRLGADITVGRSAIFKPALFMNVGAAEGYSGIGVEGSFSAMW
jgi:hypothetical protein